MSCSLLGRRALLAPLFCLLSSVACRDAGPSQAAEVLVAEGDRQIALAGHPLPSPIVAKVVDAAGEPMPGISVAWRVDDGTLSPDHTLTDVQGRARSMWILGSTEGPVTAVAATPGAAPAVFTAVAEGPAALPFDELRPLDIPTYDGSGQVVHPDYAESAGGPGSRHHLAITPYPFGDAHLER
jgi:hypothetical protein